MQINDKDTAKGGQGKILEHRSLRPEVTQRTWGYIHPWDARIPILRIMYTFFLYTGNHFSRVWEEL